MLNFKLGLVLGSFLTMAITASCDAALPQVTLENAFPALKVERPIGFYESPDGTGRFFALEQEGRIQVLNKAGTGADAAEFFNIVNRKPLAENEEGLLGMAFHPQFRSNGLFYIFYSQQNPKRSVISEFKVSAADPNKADLASERILLQIPRPYWNHDGGQLSFGPDGYLYIGVGDGGAANDPHNNGQNTASLLAKILRIDVNTRSNIRGGWGTSQKLEYGIPKDNPFVGETDRYGVRKEIYAWGLRNPWRFSWDRETGDLWVGDVGQDEWEEVDLVVNGGNYGWPVREGLHPFKPGPVGAKFVDPVIEYPHRPEMQAKSKFPNHSTGLSVTGGYVYRGKKYPALRGVYVYADYNLGTIWGLRYQDGKVIEHATLLQQPKNVVSFGEDVDGELYVLCFDDKIFKLTVPATK